MGKKNSAQGTLFILLAGVFWGSMGLFVRTFTAMGFSPVQITCLRLSLAALIFMLLLLIKEPQGVRIARRDIPLFLGLGLVSVLFFTVCYFSAIEMMSMSAAAILLYTSPIWVMLMSVVFFKEKLTGRKLIALALAFGGCVLVSGLSGGRMTPIGVLTGLCSGIGYGLYTILGTVALRRYSPFTVTAYTFAIAGLGSWLICRPGQMPELFASAASPALLLLFFLLMAIITAVSPFMLYTMGLQSVESGRAAVIATIEPLVATVLGALVYREAITLTSGLGIALILAAIVILNHRKSTGQS